MPPSLRYKHQISRDVPGGGSVISAEKISFVEFGASLIEMDAIVLDGEQRSALAVTRSLGRRGIHVVVGAGKKTSISSCSRYCSNAFSYPSPYDDPAAFIKTLAEIAATPRKSILFPMTDVTMTEVLLNREKLPDTLIIPFADFEKYRNLSDKIKLFQLARELDVNVPATFLSTEFENIDRLVGKVLDSGFPVIVKPSHSKIKTSNGWVNAGVHYAENEIELRDLLSSGIFRSFPFLIQKRVEGPGVGIFLLMKDGNVLARFAHKRIREKPPSGGVSVLCESIALPEGAYRDAVSILKKSDWTGVAMVEFKIDHEENVARLMEVNARFWGSLQLAILSGVDFPYLLFRMAMGETIDGIQKYEVGVKSRWELGDLDHLLIRIFKSPSSLHLHPGHPGLGTVMKNFVGDCFRPSVKNEVFHSDDIGPFQQEMKEYFRHVMT